MPFKRFWCRSRKPTCREDHLRHCSLAHVAAGGSQFQVVGIDVLRFVLSHDRCRSEHLENVIRGMPRMSVYMSVATIARVISVSKCADHAFVASSHSRASRGWLVGLLLSGSPRSDLLVLLCGQSLLR